MNAAKLSNANSVAALIFLGKVAAAVACKIKFICFAINLLYDILRRLEYAIMKLFIKLFISLFCLLAIGPSVGYPAGVAAQETPLVLAFYYAWFDQNTWTSGQSVDLPATRYNSADRAAIERHVAQAQSAGIDALVQSWYGPQVENNQTETNFRALLDVAQAREFKAAVDVEVTGPFFAGAADVTNALATLLSTHAQQSAYLRYQGKPVIFFWRQQRFSVDEWTSIRNQVDPERGSYWIAEGVDIEYQAVFDGHHLYSIAWGDSPGSQMSKWGSLVRNYAAENNVERLWVATAMPGYNDTNLPRDNAFAVPRDNGDYYRETWQSALSSSPDMLIITSFNEWLEGTHIEPSAGYGNLYLEVTRELAAALRGSPPAAPPPSQLQIASPAEQAQDPPPAGPAIQTGGITNVRSGPGTNFETVGRLAANSAAPVTGRNETGDWWQIEFEAGPDGRGWVAAEVVDFVGDASIVAVADTPNLPVPSENATPAPDSTGNETAQVGESQEDVGTPVVIVPAGGVNIRVGPGLEFDLLGRLNEGASAVVVAKNDTGEWWQIEYDAGENGLAWVADAVVDFQGDRNNIPLAASDTGQPTAIPEPVIAGSVEAINPVNIRSEPSEDGIILGGIYPGETAEVIAVSEDGEWWQIEFADLPDQPAWVAAEFVRFSGEKNSVPIFGIGTVTPTPGPTDTPTATPIPSPSPTISAQQPTFAPTATSLFQSTSAALLSTRGTPEPLTDEVNASSGSGFSWTTIPWGVLSVLVIVGLVWFQIMRRRR